LGVNFQHKYGKAQTPSFLTLVKVKLNSCTAKLSQRGEIAHRGVKIGPLQYSKWKKNAKKHLHCPQGVAVAKDRVTAGKGKRKKSLQAGSPFDPSLRNFFFFSPELICLE
jgi:hypothetical protein